MIVLVVVLAIIGWFRGLIAQVASVAAIAGGIWVGAVVKQWVGGHWNGAHPSVVFWALSWVTSVLAALALVSLLNVLGDRLGQAAQAVALGWLDRGLGVLAGAAIGAAVACVIVLSASRLPMGQSVHHSIIEASAPRLLVAGGERICARWPHFPGSRGLKKELAFARRKWARETPAM